MQCLRSKVPGVYALSSVLNAAPGSLKCSKLTYNVSHFSSGKASGWAGRQNTGPTSGFWRANGESATPSLHGDIATPDFQDNDRMANWKRKTNPVDRNAENMMPSYMAIGVGTGVTLYLAKYTLYGVVLLLGPSRDKYAAAAIEVDLSTVPEGKNAVFTWRGKPLFVRHRKAAEIEAAKAMDISQLRDPQTDEERCLNEKFLICIGVCTHLGCVPISHAGDWKGFYCPCHGSHYDTSGRIMKGPAPLNLEIPKHEMLTEDIVIIGKEE